MLSSGRRPADEVMTSGSRACAIQSAKRSMSAGEGCGGSGRARGARFSRGRLAQHLAWQREINGAARRGRCQSHRAIHHVRYLIAAAQFVVPFHDFAEHARLVEHLLSPVDVGAARAGGTRFGQRRAAGGEQHRNAIATGVDQHVDAVRRANVGVDHHRLRAAVDHGNSVRHADGGVLVRHHHWRRHRAIAARGARECLDDRREVGAGIDEQVVDAVRGQRLQIILGGDAYGLLVVHATLLHPRFPSVWRRYSDFLALRQGKRRAETATNASGGPESGWWR